MNGVTASKVMRGVVIGDVGRDDNDLVEVENCGDLLNERRVHATWLGVNHPRQHCLLPRLTNYFYPLHTQSNISDNNLERAKKTPSIHHFSFGKGTY